MPKVVGVIPARCPCAPKNFKGLRVSFGSLADMTACPINIASLPKAEMIQHDRDIHG
jgi:hypothetical protein